MSKASYYHDQIHLAKHDIKRTWKLLKNAINKFDSKNDLPCQFTHNNKLIKNTKEIAQQFNNFFANIGQNLSENVPQSPIPYTNYLRNRNVRSIVLDPVTFHDVIDVTMKFKSKTSTDFNNISSKLLKVTINNIAQPVSHIINLSLAKGIFPNEIKISKVVPIFKSGEKTKFTNYRPISILPTFSKILEKIVTKKLIKFLETSNALYVHQYGFRPGHNTTQPIIQLLNSIAEENDKPKKM